MAVTKRTRYEVLRRDEHRCRYCGATVEDGVKLTVDHVLPVALGGSDTAENLVAACIDCNAGKASSSPDADLVDQVTDDALRWAAAMQAAATLNSQRREARAYDIELFGSVWDRWTYTDPQGQQIKVPRTEGWEITIGKFFDAGLDFGDLDALIPVAMHSKASAWDKWKYFCGCGWRSLDDRQAEARRLIERGEV